MTEALWQENEKEKIQFSVVTKKEIIILKEQQNSVIFLHFGGKLFVKNILLFCEIMLHHKPAFQIIQYYW